MDTVRVLTLNIWNRQGPWDARKDLIRAGFKSDEPDVVGLQEVLQMGGGAYSQLDELADGIYPHRAYAPAWIIDAESNLTFGNAVLSRFPIVEREHVILPNPMQHEARSLLYVLCETPHGLLPFFVTHLDWQLHLSAVRCQQLAFIVERIEEWTARAKKRHETPGEKPGEKSILPAILAGDLNAEPNSDEVRFLRGHHALPPPLSRSAYFHDCYSYCGGDEHNGATFARSNPYAAAECEPDRRLDYIFAAPVDKARRCEPLRAWRCYTEPKDGVFASDHFGVAVDLQLAPRQKPQF